jgi:hypothetical protein
VETDSHPDPDRKDRHHFGNQDPDPHPHHGDKLDPDPHQLKIRIRIRIKVMRIRNTVSHYVNFSKKCNEKSIKLPSGSAQKKQDPDPEQNEKSDPDPDPHQSNKSDQDPQHCSTLKLSTIVKISQCAK